MIWSRSPGGEENGGKEANGTALYHLNLIEEPKVQS